VNPLQKSRVISGSFAKRDVQLDFCLLATRLAEKRQRERMERGVNGDLCEKGRDISICASLQRGANR